MILDDDALVRCTFRLGAFGVTLCSDGPFKLDGGAMFGVVPKTLWSRRIAADDQNRIKLGLNSMVVHTGSAVLVVETGVGNKQPAKMKPVLDLHERLPLSFQAASISKHDITHVVNTHLHFDHCGWNTLLDEASGEVIPTFPHAQYFAAAGELAHGRLQLERDAVSYLADNYDPMIASGQFTAIDLDGEFTEGDLRLGSAAGKVPRIQRTPEILPGVWVERLPGHTHSMLGVHVESDGLHLCFVGDLFPTRHHVNPTWIMGYDLDPITAIAEKKQFLQRAIMGNWRVVFPHDHEMPVARFALDEKGKPRVVESGDLG